MDELIHRLCMSKGAASQGLRALRNLGAVRSTYISGDRRDHYIAETNLRTLVLGFLKERVEPGLNDLQTRLDVLDESLNSAPKGRAEFLKQKAAKLRSWHAQASDALPAIARVLFG
jgi:DNA-binding transcriptional regulator GbsR (MarR family)